MSDNTFTLTHYECEHSGDIERDLNGIRSAGIRLTVEFSGACHGPEVGVSLIKTSATLEQLRAAAEKGEACIGAILKGGTSQSALDIMREEEADWEEEEEEEEDWD
jgi:hypothetical protein